jgi:hypothetical protein
MKVGFQPYAPTAFTPGLTWCLFVEAESTPGHIELSDTTGKTPTTPAIDPGTFRIVEQCLNHYATPGPCIHSKQTLLPSLNHFYDPKLSGGDMK